MKGCRWEGFIFPGHSRTRVELQGTLLVGALQLGFSSRGINLKCEKK
jgi:hypothetical protein